MNSWGYLLLITALLVLAGLMLYARFTTRSREKSLHHAPFDWGFGLPALDLPSGEVEPRDSAVRAQIRPDRATGDEETSAAAPPPRDYLDELQEAAAGLAKLMRSSPASRPDPVVHAPATASEAPGEAMSQEPAAFSGELAVVESVVVVDRMDVEEPEDFMVPEVAVHHEPQTSMEPGLGEIPVMESEVPSPGPAVPDVSEEAVFVSMEPVEAASVPTAEEDFEAAEEPLAPKILSLRELLGDAVADQFNRIDAGLDALEDLVASIEENLILLADYERVIDDSDSAGEEVDRVAAAA